MGVLMRLGLLLGLLSLAPQPPAPAAAVAIIVHPANPVGELSLAELRAYLRMDRQFWPDGTRSVLYLRSAGSPEMAVLLGAVYQLDEHDFRRLWIEKLVRGEIPARPSIVPSAAAAGARVRKEEGAISAVLAPEVPDGVKVLTIDGRRPQDAGYLLVSRR